MDKFIGFYTQPPFWADKEIPFINNPNYTKDINKSIFEYTKKGSYKIIIDRDGLISLCLEGIEKKIERNRQKSKGIPSLKSIEYFSTYLSYMNSICFLLDHSSIEKENRSYFDLREITRDEIFRIGKGGLSLPGKHINNIYYLDRFAPSDLTLSRVTGKQVIKKEIFDNMNSIFSRIFDKYEKILILSNLTKSLGEFKTGNYSLSLIIAWFIIETYINNLYKIALKDKKILGKRKEALEDNRGYPVSVRSNILEMLSYLDTDLFNKIEKVRKKRNDIVHETYKDVNKELCSDKDCTNALEVIEKVIEEGFGMVLKFNLNYSTIVLT